MIKILISILLLLSMWWYVFAKVELSHKEKQSIEKISEKLAWVINNKNPRYKNAWHIKLQRVLSNTDMNTKKYEYLSLILKNHLSMDLSPYIKKHYKEFKINKTNIENYWLNLHNNSRKQRGLINYTYDQRLNNTTIEWSYNNYEKKSMDHKRDSNDWWYNYNKIENWFQERWVDCKVKWRTTTSESIWKYGFYCTDWECSDELNISLKEIFDIYMAEETLSYPANAHYKAIVSPYISKMWLGITLYKADLPNYYEYYMTTHYCTEFK